MSTLDADTVIVGSGITGVLVAREIASPAHRVAIVERGSRLSWDDQIRAHESEGTLIAEGNGAGSVHNDEPGSDGADWTYGYVYAVGGTCNHWIGNSLRFLPEDFEMRSRYGVMTDWPLSYDDLVPYYEAAERALGVAGAPNRMTPGTKYPLPSHPLSPQDRAVAPHLRPFVPLAQARPSKRVGTRPACCGSSRCELCPVDSRFSVLNGLGETLRHPDVDLLTTTTGARLVTNPSGKRIEALECLGDDGTIVRVHANRFVLAANAIESAGLLLRSEIEDPDTGRYFATREGITLVVSTRVPVDPGHGASLETGASYAYYSGPFRAHRAAALLAVQNLGTSSPMIESVVDGLVDGRHGTQLRDEAVRRWERTLAFSVDLDEEPQPGNSVTLSPTRGSLGLPLNRVTFRPGTYSRSALEHLVEDLPRRLRPLGASGLRVHVVRRGDHLFGTLRMGSGSSGVVDSELRHRRFENLFVSGGAVFPTYAATPPTLTIAALAIRLGRMLARASD